MHSNNSRPHFKNCDKATTHDKSHLTSI